jgi:hypothetical protein
MGTSSKGEMHHMEVPSIAPAITAYLAIAPLHKDGGEEVIKALPVEDKVNIALDDLINLARIMQTYAEAFDRFAKLTSY